jgi:hypothetical protein
MSVLCHLTSSASAGLFSRAIANSAIGLHYRNWDENVPVMKGAPQAVVLVLLPPLACCGFSNAMQTWDTPTPTIRSFAHFLVCWLWL